MHRASSAKVRARLSNRVSCTCFRSPCEKTIASLWRENSSRDLKLNFARESRNCVVVRSCGADRVCRLSVDHRNFTLIDVNEFFKCRREYRILKCEHVKKYTSKGVKN